jgi:predicted transcriptional regulator
VVHNEDMTEVQQLIQELRSRGWSVAAIGRGMGVTDAAVRRWIAGTRQLEHRDSGHPGAQADVGAAASAQETVQNNQGDI